MGKLSWNPPKMGPPAHDERGQFRFGTLFWPSDVPKNAKNLPYLHCVAGVQLNDVECTVQ